MITHRHPLISSDFKLGDGFLMWNDMLILSDLHIGKTMHFRKSGMPIPAQARNKDYERVGKILDEHRPAKTIVIGDLFHSRSNLEVEEFAMITSTFSKTDFFLVTGNHDVLEPADYRSLDIEVVESYRVENVIMTHEPLGNVPKGHVNIYGHLHPGVALRSKGRQHLTVPCFHFSENSICLPAFGSLTGFRKIKVAKGDRVFALVNHGALEVT